MDPIFSLDDTYIANTYRRFPVQIVSGKGSILTDINGKKYIDLTAGIGVNSFGCCDPRWIAAVSGQLEKFQHISNLYYTEPCAQLAETLCKRTGMKKVFFSNSGAEANECAIKIARKYSASKKGVNCYNILTLRNSFHGRTLTTLSATGQDAFHRLYQPLTPGFFHIPANDISALEQAVNTCNLAGILLECIQGEGGVIPLTQEFVSAAADLANERDIPLMIDEVQTGNGRTGKLYAYMHYGIAPDIVSTAKGLGGGLPIGATLMNEKVQDVLTPGDHGSTFGGNPVCCSGGLYVLNRLTEPFLKEVTDKGDLIVSRLQFAPGIKAVTGKGLMIGVATEKPVRKILETCIENGVLCLTAKENLRLLPPLNIPADVLKTALEILANACK